MSGRLRNLIPIAAPARREPADGTESDLRVSLGFEPAWYHHRLGVDFSERWHRDPIYRRETLATMKAALHRSFPDVAAWDPAATGDLATISGCYGIHLIAAAFGMPISYGPDRWPALDPGCRLSVADLERLSPDTALGSPVVEDLFRQMDRIAAEYGPINGYPNWQGVLNNAFQLRGGDIFLDLKQRPDLARHVFAVIADTMIALARAVQERQRRSGFAVDHICLSNCTMNMISPAMYEEFLLEPDARIGAGFDRFGLHTCNWNVTPYLTVIKKLPALGYLDMGLASDLARVRGDFPEARRAVLYWPTRLESASLEEITRDLERVRRDLAPCDVVMADVTRTTPDERVNAFLAVCRRLESIPAAEAA